MGFFWGSVITLRQPIKAKTQKHTTQQLLAAAQADIEQAEHDTSSSSSPTYTPEMTQSQGDGSQRSRTPRRQHSDKEQQQAEQQDSNKPHTFLTNQENIELQQAIQRLQQIHEQARTKSNDTPDNNTNQPQEHVELLTTILRLTDKRDHKIKQHKQTLTTQTFLLFYLSAF